MQYWCINFEFCYASIKKKVISHLHLASQKRRVSIILRNVNIYMRPHTVTIDIYAFAHKYKMFLRSCIHKIPHLILSKH